MSKFTFAPSKNFMGYWQPPETIEVDDDEPVKTRTAPAEDNRLIRVRARVDHKGRTLEL